MFSSCPSFGKYGGFLNKQFAHIGLQVCAWSFEFFCKWRVCASC